MAGSNVVRKTIDAIELRVMPQDGYHKTRFGLIKRFGGWNDGLCAAVWCVVLLTSLPWNGVPGQTVHVNNGNEGGNSDALKLVLVVVAGAIAYKKRAPGRVPGGVIALVVYGVMAIGWGVLSTRVGVDSIMRGTRYVLLVLSTFWVSRLLGRVRTFGVLCWFTVIQCILAAAAVVIGVRSLWGGRLIGAFPPLHPNALGLCCGCGLVVVVLLWDEGKISARKSLCGIVLLASALTLTQSRTSIIGLFVSLVAMFVTGRSRKLALAGWGMLSAVSFGVFAELNFHWTVISDLLTRGGNAQFDGTFTGRTGAWNAVMGSHDDVASILFGSGLNVKSIGMVSRWATEQTVDGTWASAYLQAGLVGVLLLALGVHFVLAGCFQVHRSILCMLCFLIVVSVLESQLNDVSFGLAMFAALASFSTASIETPFSEADLISCVTIRQW